MSDDQAKQTSESLAELEREIRKERKFTLEEAVMRLAGPGMMKGESPVTRKQQSEAVIEDYVQRHLVDASDALPLVLFRHVRESELLLNNLDEPFVVLAGCVQRILDSEYLLADFVRETDAEWGRILGERPYFNIGGRPSNPDDPYTYESVRIKLTQLIVDLKAGAT
jgi:hypothetical protein